MKWNLVILQLFFCFFCYTFSQDEIRCMPPQILHGFISNHKMEYKENEQLRYTCENKYRPRHGIPRCLRTGWSITPECEEITCLLGPLTPGIISRMPEGKNVFRVGESVEITCSETYWLVRTKLTKKTIRCTDSGEWEHPTVCEEFACEVPYDEHVHYPHYYFGGDRRQGLRISYQCESGYRSEAKQATCTKNGWVPKPLCTEIVCPKLIIENANPLEKLQDTYKPGARVYYHCKHEPESYRSYITCNRHGDWDNKEWFLRHCIQRTTCSKPEAIDNAIIKEPPWVEDQYERGSTVEYKCSAGYMFENENSARCVGPRWTYPRCIRPHSACPKPTSEIINGTIKEPLQSMGYYTSGSTVEYNCSEGFVFENETSAHCVGQDWIYPKCIPQILECDKPPSVPYAVYDFEEQYKDGNKVTYNCPSHFVMEGGPYLTCKQGRWIGSVKCLEPCTVTVPIMDVRHIQLLHGGRQKQYVNHGDHIMFSCQGKRELVKGSVKLRQVCNNGVIALPLCQ